MGDHQGEASQAADDVMVGRRDRRQAVSDKSYEPDAVRKKALTVIQKSEETRERIANYITANFLIRQLSEESIVDFVDAMFETRFEAGSVIIEQGTKGDNFYVIEEGHCTVSTQERGEVHKYGPGSTFGDNALMYNCPRAATVVADDEVTCWAVDRETFKVLVLNNIIKKRDMYEAFLTEVPLFSGLSDYERLTIAEALSCKKVLKGEAIVRQGEAGDRFYIVETGEMNVLVNGDQVGNLKSGDYFGELALLNNEPRKATIVAATDNTSVLSFDRQTFETGLMKTTYSFLKQNAAKYSAPRRKLKSDSFIVKDDDGDSDED